MDREQWDRGLLGRTVRADDLQMTGLQHVTPRITLVGKLVLDLVALPKVVEPLASDGIPGEDHVLLLARDEPETAVHNQRDRPSKHPVSLPLTCLLGRAAIHPLREWGNRSRPGTNHSLTRLNMEA